MARGKGQVVRSKSRQKPRLFNALTERLAEDLIASARAEDPAALKRYREDPITWAVEQMRIPRETIVWSENPEYADHRWDGTPDPLAAVLRGLTTHRRIGVESGVATGKTFLLMLITFWFLSCWKNSTTITYAPKKDQLKKHLWKEVSKKWSDFKRLHPTADLADLRIRMTPGSDLWSAYGFTVGVGADEESAVKAQGAHEEHMLQIVEETPGVHAAIMEALLNTSVDEHNIILAVGNPDHQLDTLHQFCTKALSRPGQSALHVRISALDHPNVVCRRRVVPGAVSPASIEEKKKRYGEDAPLFRSRVRGISPAEATDSLIKLSWCYAARDRGRALLEKMLPTNPEATLETLLDPLIEMDAPIGFGVDVANSKDGDRGAIARGRGNVLCVVEDFPCPDANKLGKRLAIEIRQRKMDPDYVGVDGVGVGSGTVNELYDQDLRVQNLIGSHAMVLWLDMFGEEEFLNLRAQMHWLMRLDLFHGRVILPDDEELFQDLITPKWEPKGGKIKVESKEDLKKRLGRSPNKGDAAIYWNWTRQVRASSSIGGAMIDI